MNQIQINGRTATHYCNQCGALWIDFHTHWSLASLHCGKCCDNVPMGEQIVLLAQPTTPPAVEGDGWDAQAYATMRDNLEAWKQRALTAEADADRLCAEFNAENGPTHMGEPALPDVPFGMDWNTGKLHTPPGEAVSGDGHIMVSKADVSMMVDVAREWMDLHHAHVRADDIERYSYPPAVEEMYEALQREMGSPAIEALAKREGSPAVEVTDAWRLLTRADTVQAGDEVLGDDTVTWHPLAGWERGLQYDPAAYQPTRRKVSALTAARKGG